MAENEPIEVNPTIELEDEVDMGSTASERNAEAWAVGERNGVPVNERLIVPLAGAATRLPEPSQPPIATPRSKS